MSADNLGWNHLVLADDFYKLVLRGLPGWENLDRSARDKVVPTVWVTIVKGNGKSSHQMASEWDDVAQTSFYYRDFTTSGLPFAKDGETYWAQFCFMLKGSAILFQEKFGGHGNWQPGYDEMMAQWAVENGR
jgi:hypothetical protein